VKADRVHRYLEEHATQSRAEFVHLRSRWLPGLAKTHAAPPSCSGGGSAPDSTHWRCSPSHPSLCCAPFSTCSIGFATVSSVQFLANL
jgi:hypothetical protein